MYPLKHVNVARDKQVLLCIKSLLIPTLIMNDIITQWIQQNVKWSKINVWIKDYIVIKCHFHEHTELNVNIRSFMISYFLYLKYWHLDNSNKFDDQCPWKNFFRVTSMRFASKRKFLTERASTVLCSITHLSF